MSKKTLAILTILIAITLDQILKIYIKTHYALNDGFEVFSWFKIHFVENNGMAMGWEFGGKSGKLFLTLFRLVAVSAIIYWLAQHIKRATHNAVIFAIALIFSGAVGNIIDSVFYGVIFNSSAHRVATLFSRGAIRRVVLWKSCRYVLFSFYRKHKFTRMDSLCRRR